MYETLLKRWKTGTIHYVLKAAVVAHIDAQEQEAMGPGFVLKASRVKVKVKKNKSKTGTLQYTLWFLILISMYGGKKLWGRASF